MGLGVGIMHWEEVAVPKGIVYEFAREMAIEGRIGLTWRARARVTFRSRSGRRWRCCGGRQGARAVGGGASGDPDVAEVAAVARGGLAAALACGRRADAGVGLPPAPRQLRPPRRGADRVAFQLVTGGLEAVPHRLGAWQEPLHVVVGADAAVGALPLVGVGGRGEDEVDGLRRDVVPQDIEAIALEDTWDGANGVCGRRFYGYRSSDSLVSGRRGESRWGPLTGSPAPVNGLLSWRCGRWGGASRAGDFQRFPLSRE